MSSISTVVYDAHVKNLCDAIVDEVAEALGTPPRIITGLGRDADAIAARQVCFWLARNQGASCASIARYFRRDHTCVLNGYKHVQRRRIGNPTYMRLTDRLTTFADRIDVTRSVLKERGQKKGRPITVKDEPAPLFYEAHSCSRPTLREQNEAFARAMRAALKPEGVA